MNLLNTLQLLRADDWKVAQSAASGTGGCRPHGLADLATRGTCRPKIFGAALRVGVKAAAAGECRPDIRGKAAHNNAERPHLVDESS